MYFKLFKPQNWRKSPAKREDAIVQCCHSLLFCYRMMKACRKAQKVIAFLSIL